MKKKILLFLVGVLLMIPNVTNAEYLVSYHSYGVTEKEQKLIEKENQEKRSFFEELEYRFTEKDDRDTLDYTILTMLILSIVVVIIFLNKKTYVVFRENAVFEEEPTTVE